MTFAVPVSECGGLLSPTATIYLPSDPEQGGF